MSIKHTDKSTLKTEQKGQIISHVSPVWLFEQCIHVSKNQNMILFKANTCTPNVSS